MAMVVCQRSGASCRGDVAVKRDIRLDSSLMESEEDSDGEVDGDSDGKRL